MENKLRRTTPSTLAAFIELSGKDITYGLWDGWLLSCPEKCNFVCNLYNARGYKVCPDCGVSLDGNYKTGRAVYVKETSLWLFAKKKFLGYQWRD